MHSSWFHPSELSAKWEETNHFRIGIRRLYLSASDPNHFRSGPARSLRDHAWWRDCAVAGLCAGHLADRSLGSWSAALRARRWRIDCDHLLDPRQAPPKFRKAHNIRAL